MAAVLTPERKRIILIGLGLLLALLLVKQFVLKKSVPETIQIPLVVHHHVVTPANMNEPEMNQLLHPDLAK